MRRCNRASSGRESETLNIITPSWLNVDKATIFFISISVIAIIPAISIVRVETRRRDELNAGYL